MTASSATESRSAVAARTLPPWLWVWLGGYLLGTMPQEISLLHYLNKYYAPRSVLVAAGVGNGLVTVERLSLIFNLLIYVVILTGAVAAMFPHLRGRWVEWRFKLASDDRPIMTEMQRFVSSHDPSISLRVTLRSDQMARIYPVGWRSARIAVFRPLPALWRRDHGAAQAILLHEIAHRRQGDQLIVGLGSPFVMLMRAWVPAYLLLVLIPVTAFLADGGRKLAALFAVTSIEQAAVIPGVIFLPVTALWLAELGADQRAAQAFGSGAVRQALLATVGFRAPLVASALALLSHPPRRLRLCLAVARPDGTARLVAVWPAALAAWLLVLPLALAVPLLFLLGYPAGLAESSVRATIYMLLANARPVVIATAALLLAWPVLAYPWERLWSSAPRPGRHQGWWPYLAAASLPLGMLAASLAPIQVSLPTALTAPQSTGFCAQYISWGLAGGFKAWQRASLDVEQRVTAGTAITSAVAQQLDAEIRVVLDELPPDAARSIMAKTMTGLRTAVADLQAGDSTAALDAADRAFEAETPLGQLIEKCA